MRRTITILTLCLVFGLGYGIGSMKKSVDEKFSNVTEAIETSSKSTKENFDDFIHRFISDSSFQLDRVIFPIKSSRQDTFEGLQTKSIERTNWKITKLFGREEFRPQIYDNFKRELRDTDERLFCWEGVKNKSVVQYKFSRVDGLWYLIELNIF